MDKSTVSAVVKALLKKALSAIANLVRTKLLPRAVARAAKHLQDASEALIVKADALIISMNEETDEKKKLKKVYSLHLLKDTMGAVGALLTKASKHISDTVDFSTIEKETAKSVLGDIIDEAKTANADDEEYNKLVASVDQPHCDEDGCTIV